MRGESGDMIANGGESGARPVPRYQRSNPPPMVSQSPEPAWQCGSAVLNLKQEPMDEAKNDSGVTSGSDCPSASPGSDRSENHSFNSPPQQDNNNHHHHLHHHNNNNNNNNNSAQAMGNGHFVNTQIPYQAWYGNNFVASPTIVKEQESGTTDSAPGACRSSASPKIESGDENSVGEFDDQGIRIPKVNSHGKIKVHKCKQCDFVGYTKMDFWEHSRVHIKGDKILKCPRCPFVTEYKHHLEYHLLNHAGAKPFKCDHCDYSCVNKSMLNSHLKSHSKVYQYRCADCMYETKYCHSLKLHLRKYKHKPAMVLNADGSPNPLPIIDVYGTRRGPKVKRGSEPSSNVPPPPAAAAAESSTTAPPFPLLNPLLNQAPMLPFPLPLLPGFPAALPNPELFRNFQKLVRDRLEELAKQNGEDGVLDLSGANKPAAGRSSDQEEEEGDEDSMTTAFDNVEVVESRESDAETTLKFQRSSSTSLEDKEKGTSGDDRDPNKYDFACRYCEISFGEEVMYRIHMGYHGYSNAFTCNMCGQECRDRVNFFLHIARAAH